MKPFQYSSLTLSVPDSVKYIAKDLNGILYGYLVKPTYSKGVWTGLVDGGVFTRWYIGCYDVDLLANESLVGEGYE